MIRFVRNMGAAFGRTAILCLSLFLCGYEAARAARLAFTYDEATTYLNSIAPGLLSCFRFDSANNHLLNSLLAGLSSLLGGTSEFVLRLPNLLAFPVYLVFAFLILDRFVKKKLIVAAGFVLLAANPYVLDFFSLCRGYGLSLAFLMASLYFLFSFLKRAARDESGLYRPLRYSLAAASLAVLANFTLLDVYLGLWTFVFCFFVVLNIRARRETPSAFLERPARPQPAFQQAILAIALVVFNLITISQDSRLVGTLFAPVAVHLSGLDESDMESVKVFRLNREKQQVDLDRRGDHWLAAEPACVTAIGLQAPADVLGRIRRIEVSLGPKTAVLERTMLRRGLRFQHSATAVLFENTVVSLKRSVFPAFKPAINWMGDRAFLRLIFLRLLLVAGITGLAVALAHGAGTILSRWKILGPAQFRPLAGSALILAALIGYPLHTLQRSGQLYWGGRLGFIRDTVFSLIKNSFYGRIYFRGQESAVFALVSTTVVAFLIGLLAAKKRGIFARLLPGLALFTILTFTWASSALRHAIFDCPYLFGRTALFCLPLFALFVAFLIGNLSELGSTARTISAAALGALVVFSASHYVACANAAAAEEWRVDASTKTMLRDLEAIRSTEFSPDSKILLAADWRDYRTLQYYRQRKGFAWLMVREAPPFDGCGFYYAPDSAIPNGIKSRLLVLKTYGLSQTTLARLAPESSAERASRSNLTTPLALRHFLFIIHT